MALALFFANHGQPANALSQFGLAKNVTDEKRRELVQVLSTAGAYAEAFGVWRNNTTFPGDAGLLKGKIYDGGFEATLTFDDTNFGWRPARDVAGLNLSLDTNAPHAGSRSLRLDFNGNSSPDSPIVTQLVLVEPVTRYKLSFAARATNLVTGGPPIVTIKDATTPSLRLAGSAALPANTAGWQLYGVEFLTGSSTKAIIISLQREGCASSPCPIFGSLNLDSFSLERTR